MKEDKTLWNIPQEFINDFEELDGSSIKIYIVLRDLAEISKRKHEDFDDHTWIYCSYEYLKTKSKLSSNVTVRKALLILCQLGWISGFHRGYRDNSTGKKFGNEYRIPFSKNYVESEYLKMLNTSEEI